MKNDEVIDLVTRVPHSIARTVCPHCNSELSMKEINEIIKEKNEIELSFFEEYGSILVEGVKCPCCNREIDISMMVLVASRKEWC